MTKERLIVLQEQVRVQVGQVGNEAELTKTLEEIIEITSKAIRRKLASKKFSTLLKENGYETLIQ
jgi:hypothetical protein